MKLELKHLAPYLPYELLCEVVDQGKTKQAKLCGAYTDNSYTFFDTVESEHGYDSIKPILRPIIDLEKNSPELLSEFNLIGFPRKDLEPLGGCSYDLVVELLKRNYDVFDLIPEGLAIDINTIK